MAEEVERVTDPAAPDPVPETTKNKRAKRPKESSSRACRPAARKAKMLEALRAAKESIRSSAVSPAGEAKADQEHADKRPDVPEHNREGRTNWTWIIGACLAGALIMSKLQQTKSPASGPAIKPSDAKQFKVSPDAQQLKVSPHPFIME